MQEPRTPPSTARFSNRLIWVTGAAGGIGRSVAEQVAREGGKLALSDVDSTTLTEVTRALGPAVAFARALDVSDVAAVQQTVNDIEQQAGALGGLAAVAGKFVPSAALSTGIELWDEIFSINARGAFACLRGAGEKLAARGRGAMVLVGSQSAKVVRLDQLAYGASKAAATYAAKCLGLELAGHGVRVNVVHPGVTETPLARAEWERGRGSAGAHVAGNLNRFRVPIPRGAVAQPAEIAAAVCFLLSDEARHVTMAELIVDGGSSLIA
jgi:2,3-dihydro-2,3-dihydroxybenzoate dehydrogenase